MQIWRVSECQGDYYFTRITENEKAMNYFENDINNLRSCLFSSGAVIALVDNKATCQFFLTSLRRKEFEAWVKDAYAGTAKSITFAAPQNF